MSPNIVVSSTVGVFDYPWLNSCTLLKWRYSTSLMMTHESAYVGSRCVTTPEVQFDGSNIGRYDAVNRTSITLLTRSPGVDDKSSRQLHRSLFRRRDHCQACLDAPLETRRFCLGRSRIASTKELAGNASDGSCTRCNRRWFPKKPSNFVGRSREETMSIAPPTTRGSTKHRTWLVLSKTQESRLIRRSPCHR